MFNFKNDLLYLTKDNVLKTVDSYTIIRHYLGEFRLGKAISSPLGKKDKNPSFTINMNKQTGEFFYHDKRLGGGDCISFVMKLFSLDFRHALLKIVKDLGVTEEFILSDDERNSVIPTKKVKYDLDVNKLLKEAEVEINIKRRKWTMADVKFWKQYGITRRTLEKYNVVPISHIFFKNSIKLADKLAYCFREFKDYKESLTIYQPYSKTHKWVKTHDSSVWYGWNQLPEVGKRIIITKSLKDVMSIVQNTKHSCTGLQNEKILPKLGVILELRGRFEDIFILYDNDYDKDQNWGRMAAKKLEEEFGFIMIEIPDEHKCKDFSDLVKKYGAEKASDILEQIINSVIYF